MQAILCKRCGKKLALIEYGHIQIKCPKCKYVTDQSAKSTNMSSISNERKTISTL